MFMNVLCQCVVSNNIRLSLMVNSLLEDTSKGTVNIFKLIALYIESNLTICFNFIVYIFNSIARVLVKMPFCKREQLCAHIMHN